MQLTRLFFIHNPASADGRHAAAIERVRNSVARGSGWSATDRSGDAAHLARQAAMAGAEVVVAVGGDGTVHEVLNGLMSIAPHARPTLAVIPAGTGNDFAHANGILSEIEAAALRVVEGASSAIDIGTIEDDRARRVYWGNTAGVGMNATIAAKARTFQALKGNAKYVAATLSTILRDLQPFEAELTIDHHKFSEQISLVTAANGAREGGKFYLAPNASTTDGKLDLVLVKAVNRIESFLLLPRVLRGTHLHSPKVYHRQCVRTSIRSRTPLSIHADGEIFATQHDDIHSITIEILPRALRVIK